MKFEDLDLTDDVLDALYDMHFENCTPIQEKCIPEILNGRDVLGVAQTGTGKTAAYLLPILSKLSTGKYPTDKINCVIMSPTRELAQQIDQAMQGFSYYLDGVSSIAVYGGNDGNRYDQELKSLQMGADVVIATPGRFISHISLGNVDLSKVSFFVLDEADRMLDMGFSEDIMTIAHKLPANCQTVMFSATMPPKIEELAKTLLKNPVEVKLAVSKPAEKIQQKCYICHETQKMGIIRDIFKAGDLKRVIIFCGSKMKVKQVARALRDMKINCGEMHSDLEQAERDDMMFKFKSGKYDVVVATDILARGIDIDDISMVINYDVPHDAEDYVHRIGRTARAERDGIAITLVSDDDMVYFRQIEKFLEKDIEKLPIPEELGEGPDYSRKTSAKSRRRKDRNQQSHKDKKERSARRGGNRRPKPEEGEASDNNKQPRQRKEKGKAQPGQKDSRRAKSENSRRERQNETKAESTDKNRTNRQKQNSGKPKTAENGNRRKKNNSRGRGQQPKGQQNERRRSSKYEINETPVKQTKKESKLQKLIKKPLKWLHSFGKKK